MGTENFVLMHTLTSRQIKHMPNNEEETLATSVEAGTPATDTQSEAQVTNPTDEANTPSKPDEEMFLGKSKSEWEKLDIENKRLRSGQSTLERKLSRFERQQQETSNSGINEYASGEEWVNDLLLKQAEYEMKESLATVFDEYPNLPPQIKTAIQKNPRGFVKQGTVYVSDAIDDIRDYLDEYSQSLGEAPSSTPTAQPKRFQVAPTNASEQATTDVSTNKLVNVIKQGGLNELYRLFTEKKITEAQLDAAVEEAQSRK